MPHRYFCSDIGGHTASLQGADAHHLGRVMRAGIGDEVILCDGLGFDYTAQIAAIAPERIEFTLLQKTASASEADVAVTLFVGYPKQDKLELIIQKCVELGANTIVPFFSRYCVAAPKKEEQKNVRYARIAAEAAKQAGRGILPAVELPLHIKQLPEHFAKFDRVLFCYEGGGAPLQTHLDGAKHIAIVTGAEGGFSPEEAQLLVAAGAISIGLGPRILRCETAPIAALSAVMAFTENLQ